MLLRFVVDNFLSFREATEFNCFSSSKTKTLCHHKVEAGHATCLRMSAIYGANGAGKSNLIDAITAMQDIVRYDLGTLPVDSNKKFRFDEECSQRPSEFAMEFSKDGEVFYYHIAFDGGVIVEEELLLALATKDVNIFTRKNVDGVTDIDINGKYIEGNVTEEYKDAIGRTLRKDMTFLRYMSEYYPERMPKVLKAYGWIREDLQIVAPESVTGMMPYLMSTDMDFVKIVNRNIAKLHTGIDQLAVKMEKAEGQFVVDYKTECEMARRNPGMPVRIYNEMTKESFNVVFADGVLLKMSIIPQHRMTDGRIIDTEYSAESDGTHRLVELMPMLYSLMHEEKVFIVDEIERSLHPIMIKELMRMISRESVKGQFIFSTHESCLLDSDILRPDEIWFAQKDVEQATKFYPLSDYNIHNTANIERGYIQGRYGAIPFLSNLSDLNWKEGEV